MKPKHIVILMVFASILNFSGFSQLSANDSLKNFTIKIIERAIKKGKIKKVAVWDFTDINKENTVFGSHIAELISVYATNVDSIIVMDRQNLKALLREHKLKAEGFIDQNTVMQLGKFSDVDAVIVGDAIVTDKDFEVVIKVLETNHAGTIAADDQYFPLDSKMAAKLGIRINDGNTNAGNTNSPNRGFNRPINSNEQYNNAATVQSECEKKNTGDYCFFNASKIRVSITVKYFTVNIVGQEPNYEFEHITLKPDESKCLYNVYVNYPGSFEAMGKTDDLRLSVYDEGKFIAERCKSKTYAVK